MCIYSTSKAALEPFPAPFGSGLADCVFCPFVWITACPSPIASTTLITSFPKSLKKPSLWAKLQSAIWTKISIFLIKAGMLIKVGGFPDKSYLMLALFSECFGIAFPNSKWKFLWGNKDAYSIQVFEKAKNESLVQRFITCVTLFHPEQGLKKYFYISQLPAETCFNRTKSKLPFWRAILWLHS